MTSRAQPVPERPGRMPGAAVLLPALVAVAVAAGPSSGQNALGTPIPEKPLGAEVDDVSEAEAFLSSQLTHPRVRAARDSSDAALRALFAEKGLDYPADEIFLRVFKHERTMELWARGGDDSTFTLLREYPVCALPGQLGPKHRLGDFQVPEGFYFIDQFNPRSNYHLSLRVSYPNLADRMRREAVALGGDIFVHGGCETVGCVPIENRNIREVYWLAAQAMGRGQPVIPIHIFPARMNEAGIERLQQVFRPDPPLREFWDNLAEGYRYFEQSRLVPWVGIAQDGRYTVPDLPVFAGAVDPEPVITIERWAVPRDTVPSRSAGAGSGAQPPPGPGSEGSGSDPLQRRR